MTVTDKPPRRPCPHCTKTFMNGRALRSHLFMMREAGDADHPKPERRDAEVSRPADGKRVFDMTAEEE